nr:immunoglobulin light chain junction region [Macaca mulatta]MOX79796.1 immunoglobulin light chain junction region [Macaca mulatta]MOX81191.1 immunoglobulin light chain junction region [Macaca mulatta]MOX84316.1 immunoglobulin light chain junction region [Macaca mulatta]MOX84440.1 immunoglobulin light chain junction region [Macaca mulatta]
DYYCQVYEISVNVLF